MTPHFKYLILAGGQLPPVDYVKRLAKICDHVVATDGGARYLPDLKIKAELFAGDLDSLSKKELDSLPVGKKVILPRNKDFSDLEFVLRQLPDHAKKLVVGGLGGRHDHGFSNLILAMKIPRLFFCDESSWITGVHRGSFQFQISEGSTFSLVSFERAPVEIRGALYSGKFILKSSTHGVSNKSMGKNVRILPKKPLLLFASQSVLKSKFKL